LFRNRTTPAASGIGFELQNRKLIRAKHWVRFDLFSQRARGVWVRIVAARNRRIETTEIGFEMYPRESASIPAGFGFELYGFRRIPLTPEQPGFRCFVVYSAEEPGFAAASPYDPPGVRWSQQARDQSISLLRSQQLNGPFPSA
jgi:hypothetical protein